MGKNLESNCMEGQGHIFTFYLIFSGSMCLPRDSASSEWYFVNLYMLNVFMYSTKALYYFHSTILFFSRKTSKPPTPDINV